MKTKKNCNNCRYLEWVDGDYHGDSGFTCNKRQQSMWEKDKEHILLANLDREEYREKSKVCFEAPDETN